MPQELPGSENSQVQFAAHNSSNSELRVSGFASKGEIFIRSGVRPLDFIAAYCHEMGHLMAKKLSFKGGEVLTSDEVKKTKIPLTFGQKLSLVKMIIGELTPIKLGEPGPTRPSVIQLANGLLKVYSKGNFDPESVPVHLNIPDEEFMYYINRVADTKNHNTISNDGKGNIIAKSTRNGRNGELPAIAVEIACLRILTNTACLEEVRYKPNASNRFSSHYRAIRIVHRSYKPGSKISIPSQLDFDNG